MKIPIIETNFKPQRGSCIINSIRFTADIFGVNDDMYEMIGKTIDYKTEQIESRNHGVQYCYRIEAWLWDRRDISLLDTKGNIIIEKDSFPKPKQFNPDFLDI